MPTTLHSCTSLYHAMETGYDKTSIEEENEGREKKGQTRDTCFCNTKHILPSAWMDEAI